MFRFEREIFLYFIIMVPILIAGYWLLRRNRKNKLKKFGDLQMIESLMPYYSAYKPWIRFILYSLALLLITLGIANPQVGTKISEAKRSGIDIIILFDISNSMLCEDVKPSRLERAKQTISKLVDAMESDRIGIVVFAGDAFVQLPLTTDYAAAKLFLSVVEPDLISLQGTAIGKAIDLSLKSFKTKENTRKAIIIFSDGENHEDDAVASAQEAAKEGFIVHTVGMGTLDGGPVPVMVNGQNSGYMKDNSGALVTSRMSPEMLQQIASSGNGQFILAGSEDANLSKLLDKLAGLDKKEYKSTLFTDFEDRFQYVFALALFILIIEIFISDRANPIIGKINKYVESGTLSSK